MKLVRLVNYKLKKKMEENNHGLIEVLSQHSSGGTEEYNNKHQLGQPVTWTRFENENLANINLKSDRYTNLLDERLSQVAWVLMKFYTEGSYKEL
jgi:hypothetical protein